jgi:phosphatidylinositol alpha-mannosyltransferase
VAVLAPAEGAGTPEGLDAGALDGAVFLKVGAGIAVSVNGSRAPVSPWPATMARTRAALRRFAPEVVHVHEPFVPGPSLGAVVLGPRPIVATFHRSGADAAYRVYGHLAGAWSRRLDATFAVSEEARATARAAIGRLSGRVEIIENGVEVRRLASVAPWPSTGPTVVFVGRIEPRKGLEVLLSAFASLPASTRLWVVGDGPESGLLRSRYGSDPRIEWLGPLGDEERAARVAGAEVFVAPSLGGESFGVVLLEAMAAGTAVVASDLPGYRLAAGGAARLVPPGDPVALGEAVRSVLLDDAARAALEVEGRMRASACDMVTVADSYRAAYARLGRGAGSE